MDPHASNIPPNPSSPAQASQPLPEGSPGPVYWAYSDVPQQDLPQYRNQIVPFHGQAHSVSEASRDRESFPVASKTPTHLQSDYYLQHRFEQAIFYEPRPAVSTSEVPSLPLPSAMPSANTWAAPAMASSDQPYPGQDAVFGHGTNMPSGRLTCRAWFTKGECDKPPGHCPYKHKHNGSAISPLPPNEDHGQPIEADIICRTEFMEPLPNVQHSEAKSLDLENPEGRSDGPIVVAPRSFSPYEMRAKIYSLVALNTHLQSMVQPPQTPLANSSGTPQDRATTPLSVELNKARESVQELYAEIQTHHTVIRPTQPRLLDFTEPLRNAAFAMNMTHREFSLLDLLKMLADEIRVVINRHRVTERMSFDKKKSMNPV